MLVAAGMANQGGNHIGKLFGELSVDVVFNGF
jgi:hypothetical protein